MSNETEIRGNERGTSNGWGKIVAGVALVAALLGFWHQGAQTSSLRQELSKTKLQVEQLQGQLQTTATLIKQQVQGEMASARSEVSETLEKINQQMERTRRETRSGLSRAHTAARQQAGEVLTRLNEREQALTARLDELRQSHEQSSALVDSRLTGIQGDVATARTELSGTVAELKQVRGDMGVMSGLIATNAKELEALRQLGDRDYFEFTIAKSKLLHKVGDIQLALRKTDVKRNRFTLMVLADDRQVEKKDKTINEPVQFYTTSTRLPYELVVNEVKKDLVIGYLAVPKIKMPLRTESAGQLKKRS